MVSSLAKELSRLNAPAPRSIDPENEDFGADAYSRTKSNSSRNAEEELPSAGKGKDKEQGRLLRTIDDLDSDDDKYKGKKTSREKLGFNYDDIDDDDALITSLSEDSFSESETSKDVEIHEKGNENDIKNTTASDSDSDSDSQGSDSEEQVPDDDNEKRGASFTIKAAKRASPSKTQATHAKTQVNIWSKMVGFRIRMEPLLTNALRFPDPESRSGFEKDKDISSSFKKLSNSLCLVLRDLLSIREHAVAQNEKCFNESSMKLGKKRSRRLFQNDNVDLDMAWAALSSDNKKISTFYESSFNQWHQRSKLASGLSGKKLKAFDQNITDQVQQVLDSDKSGRISMRAQIIPTGVKIFGQSFLQGDNSASKYHPEVYSDSSFYQQLLKDFVLTSGLDTARKHGGDVVLKSRKLIKKKKTNVDVKASKGRRIRYTVHDKLVSFVAPHPAPMFHLDRDQLLRSLFS